MPVPNLITPVDPSGTYPAIPAGNNRLIFLTVNSFQSSTINATAPTSVTVGGVAMTWVAGDAAGVVQLRATLSTWVIKESQIASMSGSAIVITGAVGAFIRGIAWAVQDASQANPSRIANGYVSTGAITMPLARAADSRTFLAGFVATAEDITLTNPSRTSRILNVNIGYAADTAQTVNSTTQSKTYYQTAHVINIEPVPPQTITSVNGGTGIKIGSTGNAAVTNGFSSAPNAGTFGGKAITVTGYDAGTKVATFNGPVVVGGESFPAFTGTQTLVLTNGAESASLAGVPISPPTGSTLITAASPENVDEKAFGHLLVAEGVTPVDGDTFYGVDADVVWLPTTYGSAAALPVLTPVVFRDTSTGIAYELLLEVNGEGVVPPDATPDTGHRTRSLLRVSGNTLTIDGVTHTNGQPISLSPYGGVQSSINGAWLAQSVSASSGSLVVDGVTVVPPKALYLSPAGKLTTTPNGQPVAVVRS